MFNWLLKLIPDQYKWSIAIKKISYGVGKLAVGLLMFGKAKEYVGSNLSPEQVLEVQATVAAVATAALEGFHDWARVKWPNIKWL